MLNETIKYTAHGSAAQLAAATWEGTALWPQETEETGAATSSSWRQDRNFELEKIS